MVRNPVHKPFVCVGENEKLEIADVVRAINLAVCLTTGDNGSSANTPVGLSLGPRVSVFPPTNVLETPAHIFLSLKVIGIGRIELAILGLRVLRTAFILYPHYFQPNAIFYDNSHKELHIYLFLL